LLASWAGKDAVCAVDLGNEATATSCGIRDLSRPPRSAPPPACYCDYIRFLLGGKEGFCREDQVSDQVSFLGYRRSRALTSPPNPPLLSQVWERRGGPSSARRGRQAPHQEGVSPKGLYLHPYVGQRSQVGDQPLRLAGGQFDPHRRAQRPASLPDFFEPLKR